MAAIDDEGTPGQGSGAAETYGAAEPGLDLHAWESEWASLQQGVADDPVESLPLLVDLLERLLGERGIETDEPVAAGGTAPEAVAELEAAREIASRIRTGERPDPGDVAQALEGLTALYGGVVERRRPL